MSLRATAGNLRLILMGARWLASRSSLTTSGERRLVRPARLERATSWFVARRSIQLSYGRARNRPLSLT